RIRVLRLPLTDKGDPYDWIAAGGTADALWQLVDKAVDFVPDKVDYVGPGLISCCAAEIEPEPVNWIWPGRLARGKQTVFAGDPGVSKSTLSATITATVTTGAIWPCNEGRSPVGSVIILSAEDGAADTIIPRLMAAGADRSKVHIVSAVRTDDGRGRRAF